MQMPIVAANVRHSAMLAILVTLRHSGRVRREQRGDDQVRTSTHFLPRVRLAVLLLKSNLALHLRRRPSNLIGSCLCP